MKQLELKAQGMSLSAESNRQWLEMARQIALRIGMRKGTCSIEDVRYEWPFMEFPTGNWVGSVFKDGNWKFDDYIPSTHEKGHGRPIANWIFIKNILDTNPAM